MFIDGDEKGSTPLTLSLLTREAKLEIRKEGYRTISKVIRPKSGKELLFVETLLTEREARIAEAPENYKNSLSMDLKLFSPGSFTMGAPRHEKGQRANEFLKNVRLTRHFYASVHEVSNSIYRKFSSDHDTSADPQHPVVNISWNDAALFCNWLSEKEGLEPFYVFIGNQYSNVRIDADGYAGRWIPDTPGRRKSAINLLSTWASASNSSPVEGLEVAIKRYVKPNEKVSIYIFGDDYTGGSFDPVSLPQGGN